MDPPEEPPQMDFAHSELVGEIPEGEEFMRLSFQVTAESLHGVGRPGGGGHNPCYRRAKVVDVHRLFEIVVHLRPEGTDGQVLGAVASDDEDRGVGDSPELPDEIEAVVIAKNHIEDDDGDGVAPEQDLCL